jgi:hypothetical protein
VRVRVRTLVPFALCHALLLLLVVVVVVLLVLVVVLVLVLLLFRILSMLVKSKLV